MQPIPPDLDEFAPLLDRPINLKLPDLQTDRRPKHILFAGQFDRAFLERLGRTADQLRILSESRASSREVRDLLPHRRAMLYFTQTSTRTFMSFLAACQMLGMNWAEIRDPSLSSEYKGESPLDSMRMFASYSDLIIMRSVVPQFAEATAYLMNELQGFYRELVPVVNAGSGADEHPTQALLDIFTIQRTFDDAQPNSASSSRFRSLKARYPDLAPGVGKKTYTFVGDIGRGRTVKSLCTLLSNYDNVRLRFVSPPQEHLRLQEPMRIALEKHATVEEYHSIDDALEGTDVLYMTRIQAEHDTESTEQPTQKQLQKCRLTRERMAALPEYAAVMHPFPRNEEIPHELDADPRAMYFHQARNGVFVRAAIIATLFDVDSDVRDIYDAYTAEQQSYREL